MVWGASLAYLSICATRNDNFARNGYELRAAFSNSGGLRKGSCIMIAGVEVGRVKQIVLENYAALVTLQIQRGVAIRQDAMASIRTTGLIGEQYVEILPGMTEANIKPGGTIHKTEPNVNIEGLISRFVQGNVTKPAN